MSNPSLYLIGTVHIDQRGKEKLNRFLQGYQPHIIAVEMHENRQELAQGVSATIIDDLVASLDLETEKQQRRIRNTLTYLANDIMGFEVTTSQEYDHQKVKFIDSDCVSAQEYVNFMLRTVKHLLPQGYQDMKFYELQKAFTLITETAYFFYEIGADHKPQEVMTSDENAAFLQAIRSSQRDDTMAKNIRTLYQPQQRLAAIVGLKHLQPLSERLANLQPTVLSLKEAADFY